MSTPVDPTSDVRPDDRIRLAAELVTAIAFFHLGFDDFRGNLKLILLPASTTPNTSDEKTNLQASVRYVLSILDMQSKFPQHYQDMTTPKQRTDIDTLLTAYTEKSLAWIEEMSADQQTLRDRLWADWTTAPHPPQLASFFADRKKQIDDIVQKLMLCDYSKYASNQAGSADEST